MPGSIDFSSSVSYTGQTHRLEQTAEFDEWLRNLRDRNGRNRILKRLARLADGQFGDVKPVGEGVHELRMFFGPGYRVYFTRKGNVVILLLAGGDKDSQARDIEVAKQLSRSESGGTEDQAL